MNRLPIYYEGQEVAGLILNQHGFLELEYTKAWQLHGFDISVSLPRFHLKHTGYEVRAFFENMLPDMTYIASLMEVELTVSYMKQMKIYWYGCKIWD